MDGYGSRAAMLGLKIGPPLGVTDEAAWEGVPGWVIAESGRRVEVISVQTLERRSEAWRLIGLFFSEKIEVISFARAMFNAMSSIIYTKLEFLG